MSSDSLGEVVNLIKCYWPEYPVSVETLKNPSPEFVLRFYTDFVNDLNNRLLHLTNCSNFLPEFPNLEPEERLFLLMKKVGFDKLLLPNKFLLGDIYNPKPLRTKNIVKLCIHFLLHIDANFEQTNSITSKICQKSEEVRNTAIENDNLLEEINMQAKKLATIKDTHEKRLGELKITKEKYAKLKEIKKGRDKIENAKKAEIEKLRNKLKDGEYELKTLEKNEANLQEQIVTEDEYKQIKHVLEEATKEEIMLKAEDADIEENLHKTKIFIEHLQDCERALHNTNLNNKTIRVLRENKEQIKTLEEQLKDLSNKLNNAKTLKTELKKEESKLNKDVLAKALQRKSANDNFLATIFDFEKKFAKKTDEFKEHMQEGAALISNLNDENGKLNDETKLLKEEFMKNYEMLQEAETETMEYFQSFMVDINKQLSQI